MVKVINVKPKKAVNSNAEAIQKTLNKFIELDSKKEVIRKYYEDLRETVDMIEKLIGVGGSFQDSEGIVYQIDDAKGKYVTFDKYTVNRTKKEGELRGTLSQKLADELGYTK